MKKFKKITVIIVLCLISAFMAGCSSSWTCFRCGEDFRGNAYYSGLMRSDMVMDEDCARRYWFPLDIRNMRVR